jgi:hypothetical protein
MPDLTLEERDSSTFVCDCCGATTQRLWGWVDEGDATRCAYFVQWAAEGGDYPPPVTLGHGDWGEGTIADDRASIYAELGESGVQLVDHPATGASDSESALLCHAVPASGVEKDPRASEISETFDFILRCDDRIQPPVPR